MAQPGRARLTEEQRIERLTALLAAWREAAAKPHGIAVKTSNPHALASQLYAARRSLGHDGFDFLKLVEMEDEVRIVPR